MIYSIVGTHKEIREKGSKELALLGEVTQYVYSEQVEELKRHVDAVSLFGEPIIITCVQIGDLASAKEILIQLLPQLEASNNIFIIDEPFADIHFSNKLNKVSKKFFNGKEEKIKDSSVFRLADSLASRDKKQAWIDFMYLRNKVEGEAIAGALWWKFQSVWQATKAGKRSPYTLPECERVGGDIVRASIKAHRGELDLMTELERIILSL
jgi:hypothetical protein